MINKDDHGFPVADNYRIFKIPKRGHRGFRQIEAPNGALKKAQRKFLDEELKRLFPISMFVHSFRSNHSAGSNAIGHVGAKYILHMDASNFFPSITYRNFCMHITRRNLTREVREKLKLCFTTFPGEDEPRLPQGAPTSPWISNVYLWTIDNRAANYCYRRSTSKDYPDEELPMCYSRYADDIAISGPTTKDVYAVAQDMQTQLTRFGITCNNNKTHLMRPHERHQVCSVVCHTKIQPKRKWRRRLRAQIHNEMRDLGHLTESAKGKIAYWNMLKNTSNIYSSHKLIETAKAAQLLAL